MGAAQILKLQRPQQRQIEREHAGAPVARGFSRLHGRHSRGPSAST